MARKEQAEHMYISCSVTNGKGTPGGSTLYSWCILSRLLWASTHTAHCYRATKIKMYFMLVT